MAQPSTEVKARYRERHREELRAKNRAYAARRRAEEPAYAERGRERIRRLTKEQPEKMREIQRRSYLKHAEKRRAAAVAYKAAHPEKVKLWNTRRDPEAMRAAARAWAAANPARRRANYRRWCRENPEAKRAADSRYRARKVDADGAYTAAEFKALCAMFKHRCFYCDVAPDVLTADHMVPLSRGGSNAIDNIAPACRSCNSGKSDKTVEEYFDYLLVTGRWAA